MEDVGLSIYTSKIVCQTGIEDLDIVVNGSEILPATLNINIWGDN